MSFTPTLAPMSRGILATCTAKARPGVTAATLRAAYEKAYADEPFVGLLPEGRWPATSMTLGANTVLLQTALDEPASASSWSPPSTTSPRAPRAARSRAPTSPSASRKNSG